MLTTLAPTLSPTPAPTMGKGEFCDTSDGDLASNDLVLTSGAFDCGETIANENCVAKANTDDEEEELFIVYDGETRYDDMTVSIDILWQTDTADNLKSTQVTLHTRTQSKDFITITVASADYTAFESPVSVIHEYPAV
jgi:hypothetical protein